MQTQPVVRVTMFLNLMTAILKKVQTKGVRYSKQDFDKIGIYCFAWALGGLFESEDREKL